MAAARLLMQPWSWMTSPRFLGLDNVSTDRPLLLVGNHTLFGVLDSPLLVLGLHERLGIFVRSLGDHLHFRIPLWRELLRSFGVVDGTRESCRRLMRAGESILVFPGGGREVFKRKGEKYRLLWGDRTGFARMAIEHGYTIVPFAAVGAEDCYDILLDANDLLRTPLGPLVARLSPRPDVIPPLPAGLAGSAVPKPERFYFAFGKPIETRRLAGRQNDERACRRLADRTRRSIEERIAYLLAERERDPDRHLSARLLHRLGGADRTRVEAAARREPRRDTPRLAGSRTRG